MVQKRPIQWDLIQKILDNTASAEETKQWEELLAQEEEYAALISWLRNVQTEQRDTESPFYAVDAWQQFKSALRSAPVLQMPKKQKVFTLRRLAGIAAAIVILAGAATFLFTQQQVSHQSDTLQFIAYTASAGQQKNVTLPDGSRIWINAGSVVKIPAQWNEHTPREIWLEGESFFDVKPDSTRPFTVHTKQTNIRVLGTSFNINAYENYRVSVTVTSGKVLFSAANDRSVTLTKDQRAEWTADSGGFSTVDVDASVYSSWREGILRFRDEPLLQVFRTLERRFNVTIRTEGTIDELYFTARFTAGESLNHILESFHNIYGFRITRANDVITIHSK